MISLSILYFYTLRIDQCSPGHDFPTHPVFLHTPYWSVFSRSWFPYPSCIFTHSVLISVLLVMISLSILYFYTLRIDQCSVLISVLPVMVPVFSRSWSISLSILYFYTLRIDQCSPYPWFVFLHTPYWSVFFRSWLPYHPVFLHTPYWSVFSRSWFPYPPSCIFTHSVLISVLPVMVTHPVFLHSVLPVCIFTHSVLISVLPVMVALYTHPILSHTPYWSVFSLSIYPVFLHTPYWSVFSRSWLPYPHSVMVALSKHWSVFSRFTLRIDQCSPGHGCPLSIILYFYTLRIDQCSPGHGCPIHTSCIFTHSVLISVLPVMVALYTHPILSHTPYWSVSRSPYPYILYFYTLRIDQCSPGHGCPIHTSCIFTHSVLISVLPPGHPYWLFSLSIYPVFLHTPYWSVFSRSWLPYPSILYFYTLRIDQCSPGHGCPIHTSLLSHTPYWSVFSRSWFPIHPVFLHTPYWSVFSRSWLPYPSCIFTHSVLISVLPVMVALSTHPILHTPYWSVFSRSWSPYPHILYFYTLRIDQCSPGHVFFSVLISVLPIHISCIFTHSVLISVLPIHILSVLPVMVALSTHPVFLHTPYWSVFSRSWLPYPHILYFHTLRIDQCSPGHGRPIHTSCIFTHSVLISVLPVMVALSTHPVFLHTPYWSVFSRSCCPIALYTLRIDHPVFLHTPYWSVFSPGHPYWSVFSRYALSTHPVFLHTPYWSVFSRSWSPYPYILYFYTLRIDQCSPYPYILYFYTLRIDQCSPGHGCPIHTYCIFTHSVLISVLPVMVALSTHPVFLHTPYWSVFSRSWLPYPHILYFYTLRIDQCSPGHGCPIHISCIFTHSVLISVLPVMVALSTHPVFLHTPYWSVFSLSIYPVFLHTPYWSVFSLSIYPVFLHTPYWSVFSRSWLPYPHILYFYTLRIDQCSPGHGCPIHTSYTFTHSVLISVLPVMVALSTHPVFLHTPYWSVFSRSWLPYPHILYFYTLRIDQCSPYPYILYFYTLRIDQCSPYPYILSFYTLRIDQCSPGHGCPIHTSCIFTHSVLISVLPVMVALSTHPILSHTPYWSVFSRSWSPYPHILYFYTLRIDQCSPGHGCPIHTSCIFTHSVLISVLPIHISCIFTHSVLISVLPIHISCLFTHSVLISVLPVMVALSTHPVFLHTPYWSVFSRSWLPYPHILYFHTLRIDQCSPGHGRPIHTSCIFTHSVLISVLPVMVALSTHPVFLHTPYWSVFSRSWLPYRHILYFYTLRIDQCSPGHGCPIHTSYTFTYSVLISVLPVMVALSTHPVFLHTPYWSVFSRSWLPYPHILYFYTLRIDQCSPGHGRPIHISCIFTHSVLISVLPIHISCIFTHSVLISVLPVMVALSTHTVFLHTPYWSVFFRSWLPYPHILYFYTLRIDQCSPGHGCPIHTSCIFTHSVLISVLPVMVALSIYPVFLHTPYWSVFSRSWLPYPHILYFYTLRNDQCSPGHGCPIHTSCIFTHSVLISVLPVMVALSIYPVFLHTPYWSVFSRSWLPYPHILYFYTLRIDQCSPGHGCPIYTSCIFTHSVLISVLPVMISLLILVFLHTPYWSVFSRSWLPYPHILYFYTLRIDQCSAGHGCPIHTSCIFTHSVLISVLPVMVALSTHPVFLHTPYWSVFSRSWFPYSSWFFYTLRIDQCSPGHGCPIHTSCIFTHSVLISVLPVMVALSIYPVFLHTPHWSVFSLSIYPVFLHTPYWSVFSRSWLPYPHILYFYTLRIDQCSSGHGCPIHTSCIFTHSVLISVLPVMVALSTHPVFLHTPYWSVFSRSWLPYPYILYFYTLRIDQCSPGHGCPIRTSCIFTHSVTISVLPVMVALSTHPVFLHTPYWSVFSRSWLPYPYILYFYTLRIDQCSPGHGCPIHTSCIFTHSVLISVLQVMVALSTHPVFLHTPYWSVFSRSWFPYSSWFFYTLRIDQCSPGHGCPIHTSCIFTHSVLISVLPVMVALSTHPVFLHTPYWSVFSRSWLPYLHILYFYTLRIDQCSPGHDFPTHPGFFTHSVLISVLPVMISLSILYFYTLRIDQCSPGHDFPIHPVFLHTPYWSVFSRSWFPYPSCIFTAASCTWTCTRTRSTSHRRMLTWLLTTVLPVTQWCSLSPEVCRLAWLTSAS